MVLYTIKRLLHIAVAVGVSPLWAATPQEQAAAREVIARFAGEHMPPLELGSVPAENDCAVYTYQTAGGKLHLQGSSGVALCKGYYDFVRSQGKGICSWSGNRHEAVDTESCTGITKRVSPVPYHYYLNVVTYGYTMPYWDFARWEQEIDYMALHGIDMPLALVATEAISARVFKRLGLTEAEIGAYFTGPAHLPWLRMGNLCGIDGPLPREWHEQQIELQHKILRRMRALGMTPVCPGFSGFVPKGIQRVVPDADLVEASWSDGAFNNYMLPPNHPLFARVSTMFIEEWEKEFGPCSHYLIDSFNEMEIPFPPHGCKARYRLLAEYGEKVYTALKAASPNAVWVMQGWMLGYQRRIWDPATLSALISRVPNDKMILLDLAADYNRHFWKNGYNFDYHRGFYDKGWIFSVIPNMGGKCAHTGVLEFYANGHLDALHSANRGRLLGIGMAPEGLENNEVIYELMAHAGWSNHKTELHAWLRNYSICRYGECPQELEQYWECMQKSAYGFFTDHPRYNWQLRPGSKSKGTACTHEDFYKAIEHFAAAAPQLQKSPLYRADLMELAAAYLGGKVELLITKSEQAIQSGDTAKARELEDTIAYFMHGMDALLSTHPNHTLEAWLHRARQCGTTPQQKDAFEKNARRIVTIWGPPVDDYSARIWSGLIRDYYLPRRQQYLKGKLTPGPHADLAAWERDWVEKKRGTSHYKKLRKPVNYAIKLIEQAREIRP